MTAVELTEPTEEERAIWPVTVRVPLGNPFVDERGEIQPLVDLPMKSCVLISSSKGTVRANHYHKTDWHFCYVVSGEIEYHHRPHGEPGPAEKLLIKQGELFFTPPMVDHAMVFTEDTIFLTLGRNSRRQEVYEADIEQVILVDPKDVLL